MPGVFNPMVYDRYAYVFNSPLNYVDPNRHGYCDSQFAESEICSNFDLKTLTHAQDTIVTEWGQKKKRRYGGADIYALYETYRDTPGWWNNNTAGILTPKDFFGLYILFEAGGDVETAKVIATVFAQNLYVGGYNPPVCRDGGVCSNAVFNFIASQIDSSSALFKDPNSDAIQLYGIKHSVDRTIIQALGSASVDPSSVVTWKRFDGPSTWGNIKGATTFITTYHIPQGTTNGTSSNTVYYFLPDDFVVMSVNQANYWKSLNVDMSLRK